MSLSASIATTVCFIVCHGGPAEHFSTFAEDLIHKGHKVEIYATGPAFKKLQDRQIDVLTFFDLDPSSEETTAIQLAQQCANAQTIITDVGHAFDIALQKALQTHAPKVLRLAYYDNPEPYVPGNYSSVAAEVMKAAQGVLFANSHLSTLPLYQNEKEEILLNPTKRIGLGYYPIDQAEKIAKGRQSEQKNKIRSQLFKDPNQKILVYMGGNNQEYFSKALPAFLNFVEESSKEQDLSDFVVFIQQHPGAKKDNLDIEKVDEWLKKQGQNNKIPQFIKSEINSDEAQIIADAIFYYQTSMGPQFVLAGIPTIQVGHNTYEDILVKNQLCPSVTNSSAFRNVLAKLQEKNEEEANAKIIYEGLGITENWSEKLEDAIKSFQPLEEDSQTAATKSNTQTSFRSYVLGAALVLGISYGVIRLFQQVFPVKT